MYYIYVLPFYYQPDIQGNEAPRPLRDERSDEIAFEAMAEAKALIYDLQNETYILSHGEYARPNYVVVDEYTYDYIRTGRFGDLSNYNWDDCPCDEDDGYPCGECAICYAHTISQDRQYIKANAAVEHLENFTES